MTMLYTIFLVCTVGTNDCQKMYAEIPRPPGMTVSVISDEEMLRLCTEQNKEDRSFDQPVINPRGVRVKITPSDCVLGNTPPPDASPANGFVGYRQ
jgi:hypothetical protein